MDTSILTPIAEHNGVLIHEETTGVVYFLDSSDHFHCRNLRLSKRSRLEWIKRDIDAYRSRGWV